MAIAKPTHPAATVVTGLLIKPPYVVQVKTPAFPGALDTSKYSGIDYTIYIDGTKPEDYDQSTQTSQNPLNVAAIHLHAPATVNGQTKASAFDVRLQVREYYTGSGVVEATIGNDYDLTKEHDIETNFHDTNIAVKVDGDKLIDTNMFKEPPYLYRITLEGVAYDTQSQTTDLPAGWDAPFEINVIQGIDLSGILNEVLPVVVSFAVGMATMSLIMKALGGALGGIAQRI